MARTILRILIPCFVILCQFKVLNGKKHALRLKDDERKQITVSTFGFLKGGILFVNITNFHYEIKSGSLLNNNLPLFGFTLDKSGNPGLSSYMESGHSNCILQDETVDENDSVSVVFFKMNLKNKRITIERRGKDVANLTISHLDFESFEKNSNQHKTRRAARKVNADFLRRQTRDEPQELNASIPVSPTSITTADHAPPTTTAKQTSPTATSTKHTPTASTKPTPTTTSDTTSGQATADLHIEMEMHKTGSDHGQVYNTHFLVAINSESEEGLYNLFFHNCINYMNGVKSSVYMTLNIVEVNNGNYLSAGNQPEPTLFFVFFITYLICGGVWLMVLRRSEKNDVFKIHYLMLSVVWVKSLSCLFHGINSHFIEVSGIPEEAWAILWYIVYLTKGALMFGTILLIGAGWAFIKHMLSQKEKKLFAIFLPLQILDQVAWVIVEESDEGMSRFTTWKQIFFVVDLLCCGAILFPVVWSIRHLQEASRVDGKAAMNLNKLKLFRHFYIMVVCYIYFTRMIVYLLQITLPFRHEWLKEFSKELAVFLFFFVTGYKFQPATDNPYLQIPIDSDDEIEMEEVLTKTGTTDGLTKVNQHLSADKPDEDVGIKQRESSLEYD